MKFLQPILILLLVFTGIQYLVRSWSTSIARVVFAVCAVLGVILILLPDLTSKVAELLGVDRGADLIMYLGLMSLIFLCQLLYSKERNLEITLTNLVRAIALAEANCPKSSNDYTHQEILISSSEKVISKPLQKK